MRGKREAPSNFSKGEEKEA